MPFSSSPKLLRVETTPKKKQYQSSINPQTCNPTYNKPINVGCRYCGDKSGRPKNFGNLNRLYFHFCFHHSREPRYKELTMDLAQMILDGTLL